LHRSLDELEPLTSLEAKVCLGWLTAVKGIFLVARSLTSREAYDLCLRGVTDLRELNQKNMLLVPLLGLFKTALQVGEPQVAYQSAEECLQIATEIQDLWGIVKAQHLFALLAIDARDYEVASAYATSALKTCKRRNDRWSEGMLCIEVLATIAIHQKAYGQAREWLEQGLEAAASIHFVYAVRAAYFQLGYVAVLSNDFSEAAQQWNKALAINDQVSLGTTGFWGKEIAGDYPASLNSTDKAE
jgi:tetratricopeptide (TPR) repeat protein